MEDKFVRMVNITNKRNSLRIAIASATVQVSRQETIDAINNKTVPKGDVFEFSRAAGLLGVKRTSDSIPDCHPLPVEYTSITHSIDGLNIVIEVEVHTIYKTGVEVEAMHGAAITALTIYDMLKPIDKGIEIKDIKLLLKKGGKSDATDQFSDLRCAVIVCSDSVSKGKVGDVSGNRIVEKLANYNLRTYHHEVIPDDKQLIAEKAIQLSNDNCDLLLFTGGTGLSPRDVTPDALEPLIDRFIPGIMEAARQFGQQHTPFAMLSRGIAGFIKNTLVITLPGSVKGVEETMDAVFPHVLHVFKVKAGMRHS